MTPSDLVLAAMLISAAPGTPELPPTPEQWVSVQAALHKTAIEWEILDERETRYVLARLDDYEPDLNLLRRRRVELADAPLVADSVRLPDRQTINEYIRFNRAVRKELETRRLWEPDRADRIGNAIADVDRAYKVWDAVRDSRTDFYYATVRRQSLLKLKNIVGPTAYTTGDLPPYVPEWYFQHAR